MALGEFQLIERYFRSRWPGRADVLVGIGDDAAVLSVPDGHEVVVAVASSGACPAAADAPAELGHRVLASALGALAAAGAEPAWATLALTLPRADPRWLDAFSAALFALAGAFGIEVVGGDTTRGPLAATVHAHGLVPRGTAIGLDGARPGHLVYVTGTLGAAGLALLARTGELRLPARERAAAEAQLARPRPRVEAGLALRGLASAATDLPDGLAAGLSELLRVSGAGATLFADQLPVAPLLALHLAAAGGPTLPLTAPAESELCFTLPAHRQAEAEARLEAAQALATWVGVVDRSPGLRCMTAEGTDLLS
jgi:thiamine-monophosphate kinase